MEKINPKILVVSDIHLGSLDSQRELFTHFLNDILNGKFGNDLQALILLGDFMTFQPFFTCSSNIFTTRITFSLRMKIN